MPSHDELQKKYKTVSTSASEVVEHVVLLKDKDSKDNKRRRRVKIKKGPKRRRKGRLPNRY